MKKVHIFGLIVIALAIGIIVSTYGSASTYSNFSEAEEMAKEGETSDVHVVGKLKKDETGQIVGMKYDPVMDVNHFEFILIDTNRVEKRVVYLSPKPQDFDKSEQVVIIGKIKQDYFECNKILMKCPSKYTNEKPDFKEVTSQKM